MALPSDYDMLRRKIDIAMASQQTSNAASVPNFTSPSKLRSMVLDRMRVSAESALGFHHFECICRDDMVFVTIIPKTGEPAILKDSYGLFPSDQLITQLRIIKG